MFKQILGKLPKKSHKSSQIDPNNSDIDGRDPSFGATHKPLKSSSSGWKGLNHYSKSNMVKKMAPVSSRVISISSLGVYEALSQLSDVPGAEKPGLFIRKLNMCCIVFDFVDTSKHIREKDIKKQTLNELVEYISTVATKFSDVAMQEITKMVACNIFRALPSSYHRNRVLELYDLEEEEQKMEPAWPHLQIVYEFLLRFISSQETDAKLAKRYINHAFVLRLLDLFDSEDQREREYLKTILHRIYGKFMVHRPFIRKAINNIFFQFIFETERHNGIAELLEILGSIINGFALPLKEEHKLFLVRALIPLHKPKCVSAYHQQLSYCITQFVEKDFKLADTIIQGLLKYWPITNSSKEVMFLNELEEVLEVTQTAEFQRCMVSLFCQIGHCINSSHFQVAERALFLWNNDQVRSLIIQHRGVILPIIYPWLEKNVRSHWNQAVQSLTLNVQKIFSEVDPKLLEECSRRFQEEEARKSKEMEERRLIWKYLEDVSSNATSTEPVLVNAFSSPSIAVSVGSSLQLASS